MKQFIFLLFNPFFAFTAHCTNNEDLQKLVLEAEKQWNAGNPDKGFLSAGNNIEYGLGYLKKNKFTESLWYFEEVIKKDSSNAYSHLFAGLAHIGLQQFVAAEANFSKLGEISATLQEQVKTLLLKKREEAAVVATTKASETTKNPEKLGNTRDTKPVTTKQTKETPISENKKGSALVYGDYVFTLDYWDVDQRRMMHQQKGFFTINANGTYSYMGTTGKYSYNAATGVITWQSGTFKNMGKNTTTFQRNKTTCEIDFEYQTGGGRVYYSGGRNL